MARASTRGRLASAVLTAAALALAGGAPAAAASGRVLDEGAELYLNPDSTTLEAAEALSGQARADALLLGSFPTAHWLTSGSPQEVQKDAKEVVKAADKAGQVPVLVAYNLPFRDCAQYSAGGATSVGEYQAWIDGVVRGIGNREAVVILEPDGLGIIPWYDPLGGAADDDPGTPQDERLEWCQPAEADAETAAAERFEMLNYAVDAFDRHEDVAVYLDGTHNGWLGTGDAADRLIKAGVQRADGFFLNVSNYQETGKLTKYGEWLSRCIDLGTRVEGFDLASCASQYYPPTAEEADASYARAFAAAGITFDPDAAAHFVIDTSRNGQGPWTAPAGAFPDPQEWCNPLDRGLGLRPTTDTGHDLLDAHLWIKVPGESDGECYRGTDGPEDPARGMVDPAAGQWFPEQARELIELADPAL